MLAGLVVDRVSVVPVQRVDELTGSELFRGHQIDLALRNDGGKDLFIPSSLADFAFDPTKHLLTLQLGLTAVPPDGSLRLHWKAPEVRVLAPGESTLVSVVLPFVMRQIILGGVPGAWSSEREIDRIDKVECEVIASQTEPPRPGSSRDPRDSYEKWATHVHRVTLDVQKEQLTVTRVPRRPAKRVKMEGPTDAID